MWTRLPSAHFPVGSLQKLQAACTKRAQVIKDADNCLDVPWEDCKIPVRVCEIGPDSCSCPQYLRASACTHLCFRLLTTESLQVPEEYNKPAKAAVRRGVTVLQAARGYGGLDSSQRLFAETAMGDSKNVTVDYDFPTDDSDDTTPGAEKRKEKRRAKDEKKAAKQLKKDAQEKARAERVRARKRKAEGDEERTSKKQRGKKNNDQTEESPPSAKRRRKEKSKKEDNQTGGSPPSAKRRRKEKSKKEDNQTGGSPPSAKR
eukprot:Hpha_TRINITY_DN8728_c0_g1::TRINITY_DN8728_c0_g1_i1::g.45435::m.45435